MDLYCYDAPLGNFGDDLNFWFWDQMLPGWRDVWADEVLVGVGTLINDGLPRGRRKLVIGSGAGYGPIPAPDLMAECRFEAVRGPRSAAALGLPLEKGIVDPAVMLSDFPEFRDLPRSGRPIFVPHEASMHRNDWGRLCAAAGVDYVSPGDDAKAVIRRLATAPLVIAESMHAVIIADAFGTPWHAVSISHFFNGAKWLDWADSIDLSLKIEPLYPSLDRVAQMLPKRPSVVGPRRGASTVSATAAGPKPKGPMRGMDMPLRLRLRMEIEALLTPTRLRKLAAMKGTLSDRVALARVKQRYQAVIDRVLSEFPTP
ncbi:MAG: hypothetical protein ACK4MS_08500 [Paracoccaceae bacterium]